MEEFETESSVDSGPHGSGSLFLGLMYCRIFIDILLIETHAHSVYFRTMLIFNTRHCTKNFNSMKYSQITVYHSSYVVITTGKLFIIWITNSIRSSKRRLRECNWFLLMVYKIYWENYSISRSQACMRFHFPHI